MFHNGMYDNNDIDRELRDLETDLSPEPTDRELPRLAMSGRDGLAKAVARQEEIVRNLEAQENDARNNLLPLAARIAAERRKHERRLHRMRAFLAKADGVRRQRDAGLAGRVSPEETLEARAPAIHLARMPRFTGRNLSGVPVYAGPLRVPSPVEERHAWRRATISGSVAAFALLLLAFPPANPTPEVQTARIVFLLVCIVIGGIAGGFTSQAIIARQARRRFGSLTSVEEFSERRGVPELTFVLTARAQGVAPRCIVNGKEYYDLADFGDAAVLLRPAEASDADALLRAAGHAETDDEERLLRPLAGERRE